MAHTRQRSHGQRRSGKEVAESTLFSLPESNIPAPDLFSQEISHSGSDKERSSPEQKTPVIEFGHQEHGISFQEREIKEKDPGASLDNTPGSFKKLEKIVFFYTDKTFMEYKPGN
jgi:hypothetical protein